MDQTTNLNATIGNTKGTVNTIRNNNFQALLPTAIAKIRDRFGVYQKCRVLLDSGSQASFISEKCIQRLQLKRQNANISIKGLTSDTVNTRGKTSINLSSCYDDQELEVEVLILNQLPSRLPSQFFDLNSSTLNIKNLQLADPNCNSPSHIDIMIGSDKFFHILREGRIEDTSSLIVAHNTIFGWVLAGNIKYNMPSRLESNFVHYNFHLGTNQDEILRRFWELEELQKCDPLTDSDKKCENYFKSTYKRASDGRFIVRLPFNELKPKLGNSICIAEKRFYNLERKLNKNEKLKTEYIKVMREYIELGHMREIKPDEVNMKDNACFYLPHHCVIKESSKTTKMRVVFDGSSKSSNGLSINDNMMVGPTIQPSLWSTLQRFRYHKVALAADIEKMYRQVTVSKEDQNY